MITKILEFIKQNNLIPEKSKILVGLSGGPDSVFLLHILKEIQTKIDFKLIAAHLDHEWRKESFLDAQFSKQIADKLDVPIFIGKASQLETNFKFKGSKEELGRQMRRFFLEKIASQENANRIALAHHLQDQEENFLIRIIRGTTLSGLVGMKPIDGVYIRPLLEINKYEILEYLNSKKIEYVIDPSNESSDYLRNRIRNNVIPSLRECDARFDHNFLRTLNKLKKTNDFLQKLVEENFDQISTFSGGYTVALNKLFLLDEYLQHQLIFYWMYKSQVKFELTEQFINEIIRFLKKNNSAKHEIHHEWYIEKNKNLAKIIKR